MKKLIILARSCYAIALIVYGLQQLYFGTFRDVFFSAYQQRLPLLNVFAYLFGLYLVATAILIFLPGRGKKACQVLGCVFMLLFLGTHITWALISEPNKLYHLGLWTTPLKELALAGCSFVVASSFGETPGLKAGMPDRITPYGNLFFLWTITSYGISHIIYAPQLTGLIPSGLANPEFWVTLTGICLAVSGVAIFLGIRIRVIGLLLSLMIFIWIWTVHLPDTLSKPLSADRGNLLASTFDALAFSSTALLIAFTMRKQKWVEDLESWGEEKQIRLGPGFSREEIQQQ